MTAITGIKEFWAKGVDHTVIAANSQDKRTNNREFNGENGKWKGRVREQ